ncbi:hypothetical protein C8R44DRAFT_826669 [Mycena epipterygia]|nr:hypothetical protein C8R44DRAFT_826669 [Mycena epipterygia]
MTTFADLPLEMIAKILRHAVASPVIGGIRPTAWHLGHIDRQTRAIANATPQLWSDFDLRTFAETSLASIECQLERIGNGDLRVILSTSPSLPDMPGFLDVLNALSARSDQWAEVSISIYADQMAAFPVQLPLSRLHYLSTTIMEDNRHTGAYEEDLEITCFATAPALCLLQLHIPYHPQFHVHAPYAQLLALSIDHHDRVCNHILPCTANLEELEVKVEPSLPPPQAHSTVLLPRLRIISPPSMGYLSNFDLPALKELVATEPFTDQEHASLVAFLSNSPSTTITVLHLPPFFELWDAHHLLTALPSVTTLVMQVKSASHDMMRSLTIPSAYSADVVLVPALTHLVLCMDREYTTYQRLIRMVRSRTSAGSHSRLRTITLSHHPVPRHVLAELLGLKSAGLTVVVNSTSNANVRFPPLLSLLA